MTLRMVRSILPGIIFCAFVGGPANAQTLHRDFSERLAEISVENSDGMTEARSWTGSGIRVIASRRGENAPMDSEIFFERTSLDRLRILVRSKIAGNPITLTVYVPASSHFSVSSAAGSFTISLLQDNGMSDATDKPGSSNGVKLASAKSQMAFAANPAGNGNTIRNGEDVIKLEARLVNLNVKVADAGGKTLPALKQEDFAVYEDGLRQDISYFEPIAAPLHIVLLLDLSGSTDKKMKVLKKAAQKFVDSLRPTDTIAVAGFTRRFFIISNFTTDHKLLKDRIDDIKNRHSGTAYYDAMWATLDLLEEAKATRKAIVVLTDGVDNSLDHPDDSDYRPKHGFDMLIERVQEADATIYPVYLDTEYETIGRGGRNGHDAYVTARRQLEALAEQTGAVMFKAERAEDLQGVYQQVAAELHSLYGMAYTPKVIAKDGKWRKIRIDVSLPGAKARTKRGYFAR